MYWDKLPRKKKKAFLGWKLNKAKLRKLIASVQIIPNQKAPFDSEILPFAFCPKCGCREVDSYDHGVPYPERWVTVTCARCKYPVGESDNSPFVHCLETIGID